MNTNAFYKQLFAPLARSVGPLDPQTLMAIVGFDADGPLSFRTIGRASADRPVTYVSCELAVRSEQEPASFGRYELLVTCDDEDWVRSIVGNLGRMSLEVGFDDGHTLDIGSWVDDDEEPIQGMIFEKLYDVDIDGQSFGVLSAIGVTREELEHAMEHGTPSLVERLRRAGVYPATIVARSSVPLAL